MKTISEIEELLKVPWGVDATLCREQLAQRKKLAVAKGSQAEAKHIWCLEQILEAHSTYQAAFSDLKSGEFYQAWCKLDRVEITLSFLWQHFKQHWREYSLDFLEEYVAKWQSLFPYKAFASSELVKELVKCSICSKRMGPRDHCEHEVGEIYNGEMCVRVIEECDLVGISIVENPANKYAVAFMKDPETNETYDHYNYALVDYAAKALRSAYARWSYERTQRRQPLERYAPIGRNDKCPCGSGKKYKTCCFNQGGILSPHIVFQFERPPSVTLQPLTYIDEWSGSRRNPFASFRNGGDVSHS